jgi:hypothetical protein
MTEYPAATPTEHPRLSVVRWTVVQARKHVPDCGAPSYPHFRFGFPSVPIRLDSHSLLIQIRDHALA